MINNVIIVLFFLSISCITYGYTPKLPNSAVQTVKNIIEYPEKVDSIINYNVTLGKKMDYPSGLEMNDTYAEILFELSRNVKANKLKIHDIIEFSKVGYSTSISLGNNRYNQMTYQMSIIITVDNKCVRFVFMCISDVWFLEGIITCEDFMHNIRRRRWIE